MRNKRAQFQHSIWQDRHVSSFIDKAEVWKVTDDLFSLKFNQFVRNETFRDSVTPDISLKVQFDNIYSLVVRVFFCSAMHQMVHMGF